MRLAGLIPCCCGKYSILLRSIARCFWRTEITKSIPKNCSKDCNRYEISHLVDVSDWLMFAMFAALLSWVVRLIVFDTKEYTSAPREQV
jgi:hypothetical protein